jgi:drug/metabolite transporter (DMT)-like permease
VLGAILALLSAATFALNNAAARRGVVTGSPIQGMAISIPMGVVCFLPVAILTGEIGQLMQFPAVAAAWMAGVGLLHFILGRFCNYSASQASGVNLTAPVIQLQVIVTLILAVAILHEPCTALQMIGGAMIFIGSIVTQQQPARAAKDKPKGAAPSADTARKPAAFVPRRVAGYVYASGAALAYGSSPIMARHALEHTGPMSGILGGLIAYAAATLVVVFALLSPAIRRNVAALKRENVPWFVGSGVFVAMAQGFFFSAVAVAPIMLVMPLLQMSLVFRLLLSAWLNPDHEVFGPLVYVGVATAISGALMVSIDTDFILNALGAPEAIARVLRWRV